MNWAFLSYLSEECAKLCIRTEAVLSHVFEEWLVKPRLFYITLEACGKFGVRSETVLCHLFRRLCNAFYVGTNSV